MQKPLQFSFGPNLDSGMLVKHGIAFSKHIFGLYARSKFVFNCEKVKFHFISTCNCGGGLTRPTPFLMFLFLSRNVNNNYNDHGMEGQKGASGG